MSATPSSGLRDAERLRQETVTFEQNRKHDSQFFLLRLMIGITATIVLLCVALVGSYMISRYDKYPVGATVVAASLLLVDVLATVAAVWKLVLGGDPVPHLKPTITDTPADRTREDDHGS